MVFITLVNKLNSTNILIATAAHGEKYNAKRCKIGCLIQLVYVN